MLVNYGRRRSYAVMEALNIPGEFAYNMEPNDPGMDEDPDDGTLYTM